MKILFKEEVTNFIYGGIILNKSINNTNESNNSKLSEISIWGLSILGGILILVAVVMPFIIRKSYKKRIDDYKNISDLAGIGDFIGGTTVAFLTAASVFLLLATIIMQRKEIKISQKGIDELVKQTSASVEQAEEAKKETQITNETMKRQQFETTFFNMVNLHQNAVNRLNYNDKKGIEVIESSMDAFRDIYMDIASEKFKKMYIDDDYGEIVALIQFLQVEKVAELESVQIGSRVEVLKAFHELDFRSVKNHQENKIIREFFNYADDRIEEESVSYAYYIFNLEFEGVLGSYFNSITTIIMFLHESQFEIKDRENNSQNNKIYREILYSQFSADELMMIYYLAKYSWSNEWLLEDLKSYNLFYPRLGETMYLFYSLDSKNIRELKRS